MQTKANVKLLSMSNQKILLLHININLGVFKCKFQDNVFKPHLFVNNYFVIH